MFSETMSSYFSLDVCLMLSSQKTPLPAHVRAKRRTDYARVIVILLTRQESKLPDPSLAENTGAYWTGLFPQSIVPASPLTVHLKCSSVTSHNNEQKQPSKSDGWAGKAVHA